MARSLFICGTDQQAGSSVVTLGLAGWYHDVSRLAFFKPVGNGAADQDVAVMKQAFNVPDDPAEMCPVTVEEAREMFSHGKEAQLLDRISASFKKIAADREFVIIEGINNQKALNVFDMAINELIATHLNVPVLLVARGGSDKVTDVDQLVASLRTAKREMEQADVEVLGVVINRLMDQDFEQLCEEITEALNLAELPVYGMLPALTYLGFPKMDQVADELDAEVLTGRDALDTVVTKTVVAAMEPRNFLQHLDTDKTLVVVPGDRESILLAVAAVQKAPNRRTLSGVVLTGGIETAPEILKLIRDLELPRFPVIRVSRDTFQTATRINSIEARIRPQDRDKIDTAISAVGRYLEHEQLWERLQMPRPRKRTGSRYFLEELIERARASNRRIVLPEGTEPRTIAAVGKMLELQLCPLALLGPEREVRSALEAGGVRPTDALEIIDPTVSDRLDLYVDTVVELRKGKKGGMTPEVARQWLLETEIHFGTLMVKLGDADGLVAGAIHSTGDTIRPAFQIIKVKPDVGIASSVFFMALADRVLVYGDCAVVPDPNAEELAAIAFSSAATARAFGLDPRVAMLSYSTGRSGAGSSVDKVTQATQMVRERNPDFPVDGPLQYDAAIDPDVGKLKQPDSPVAGQANVFIFPDLDAGNIAYKAVQRSAGALAVGPVMQGLNKPVNDLSRGCKVDDIVYTVAVTAIQAAAG
jgi:phosphate acetyltransferase